LNKNVSIVSLGWRLYDLHADFLLNINKKQSEFKKIP